MPPLQGVIHAAGLLDDGILLHQNWGRFERVFAPKVQGAWQLHTLTCHLPLDFFVMFSSTASLMGSPGQGNYAAANSFMDVLAHHRRSLGLPATSINWGGWAEIGLAARHRVDERVALQGMGLILPAHGLAILIRYGHSRRHKLACCQWIGLRWQHNLPLAVNRPCWQT